MAGAAVGALLMIGVFANSNDAGSAFTPESTTLATVSSRPTNPPRTQVDPPATAIDTSETPAPGDASPAQVPDVLSSDAMAKLATLSIKGRAPRTGYDRDLFGSAWTDDVTVADGHNGCDTRNDILRRDLFAVEIKPGSNDCAVLAGVLEDPYTGTTVTFSRGKRTSSEVQIDHVVPLSDAWQKGAQQWDDPTRTNFANDPANLQATIGSVNQQKSDGDAATWLPPNKPYRCTYVSRIVDVKAAYGLWVTQAEHDAIASILGTCATPDQATEQVPDQAPADIEPTTTLAPAPVTPAQAPPGPEPAPVAGPSGYYRNCKAAKAAGAAPLYAGAPGYRIGLDGDRDGVACER